MSIHHFSDQELIQAINCPRQYILGKKLSESTAESNNSIPSLVVSNIVDLFAKNSLNSKKFQASLSTDSIETIKSLFLQGLRKSFNELLSNNIFTNLSSEEYLIIGDMLTSLSNDLALRFIKLDTTKEPLLTLKKLFLAINYSFDQPFELTRGNERLPLEIKGKFDWLTVNPEDNSITVSDFKLRLFDTIEAEIPQIALFGLLIDKIYNISCSAQFLSIDGRNIELKNISIDIIEKNKEKIINQLLDMNNWLHVEEFNASIPFSSFISSCKNCPIVNSCIKKFGTNPHLESLGLNENNTQDSDRSTSSSIIQNSKLPKQFSFEPDKNILEEISSFISKTKPGKITSKETNESIKKAKIERNFVLGTKLDSDFSVKINPIVLLKHLMTIGPSASGKTVMSKIIIEEALIQNIPCLLIDSQGDLSSLGISDDEIGRELRKRMQFKIYTPNSNSGSPIAINILKTPLRELVVDESYLKLILENTSTLLLELTGYSNKKKVTTEKDVIESILREDWINGISHTLQSFAERIQNTSKFYSIQDHIETEMNAVLVDRKKTDLCKSLMKLGIGQNFINGNFGLDFKKMLNKPALSIINLSGLGSDPNKRQVVVSYILRLVYDWLLRNPIKSQDSVRLILLIDEIADYASSNQNYQVTKQILLLLMRQARKNGCAILLATQNPASVDYKSIGELGTILIGKGTSQQILSKLDPFLDNFGLKSENITNETENLKLGQFFLIGDDSDEPTVFNARKLHSKHQSLSLDEIELILSNYDDFV